MTSLWRKLGGIAKDIPEDLLQTIWLAGDRTTLLASLHAEGVEYVWMNHWAGQPAMFDARARGQRLIAYDWYDVQAGGIDRFPEYLPLVEGAPRPAFVLVTDESQPELERALRSIVSIARVIWGSSSFPERTR